MDTVKSLFIIAESQIDARIIHTLLNCESYEHVYQVPVSSFSNMSSVARTLRLKRGQCGKIDKIIVAFDADTEKKDVVNDRVAIMRYLTNADHDNSMEVFCFVPNIEVSLYPNGFPNKNGDVAELTDFMKKHIEELREVEIIKDMQSFIDEK